MKNKKSIYILLPLVIVIWGTIFWKVFNRESESDYQLPPLSNQNKNPEVTEKDEPEILSLSYDDPFLRYQPVQNDENSKPTNHEDRQRQHYNSYVVPWPDVEFVGVVGNRNKKSLSAILRLNQREYLVKEGQVVEEITIATVSPDSIGLNLKTNTRYFLRKGYKASKPKGTF